MARCHALFLTGSAALLALCGYIAIEERNRLRLVREIDRMLDGLEAAYASGESAAGRIPPSAYGRMLRTGPILASDMPLDLGAASAPREDRCTVCHATIADPRYADLDLLCDDLLLKAVLKADGTPDAGGRRYISEKYGDPGAIVPMVRELAAAFGVARALPQAARALKAHPRLDLFVGPDSPHPIGDYGCTICHGGMGIGTSFQSAAHSPGDEDTRKRWEKDYGWVPHGNWPRPMLPLQYVEASCAKCHSETDSIRGAPVLSRGFDLAAELGCCNCHPFGESSPFDRVGRVGWDLRRIGEKTSPGWATDFVKDPTAFRPTSKMPRFFGIGGLSVKNSAGSKSSGDGRDAVGMEEAGRLSGAGAPSADEVPSGKASDNVTGKATDAGYAEARCIAEYLFAVSAAPSMAEADWAETETGAGAGVDPGTGRELFRAVGCLGCHSAALPGLQLGVSGFGPDLSRVGEKTSAAWLKRWLRSPAAYWTETRMPSLRLSESEAAAIASWISGSLRSGKPASSNLPPLPPARVLESLAADAGAPMAGDGADGGMPGLFRGASSAGSIGERSTAKDVEGGRPAKDAGGPGVPGGGGDPSHLERAIAAGRRLARRYGCFACHSIGGMSDEPKPGPDHGAAGDKDVREIQFGDADIPHTRWDYFSRKITDPRAFEAGAAGGGVRLRMPKFDLSDGDVRALTTLLLSFTAEKIPEARRRRPPPGGVLAMLGERAIRRLNCAGCHLIGLEEDVVPLARMADPRGRRELETRGGWIVPDVFRSPDGLLFAGAGTALTSRVMAVLSGEVLGRGSHLRRMFESCATGKLDAAGPAGRRLPAGLRLAICSAGLEPAGGAAEAEMTAGGKGYPKERRGVTRPAYGDRLAFGVRVRVPRGEAAIRASGIFDRLQDAPPSLAFEGGKTRPDWLYGFLKDPGRQTLRPGLKVRMPSFFFQPVSDTGATGGRTGAAGSDGGARGSSGGPPMGKPAAVYRSGRLSVEPKTEGTFPEGYDEAFNIVEYFLKAAGAGRFEPTPIPRIDTEKYRRGAFLLGRGQGRLGCTDCHPVGGSRPGGPKNDWGSDLADVKMRLREDWLRRFLRQPAAFYPWTNMPSSFYSFANYRENEDDPTRAIFRRPDNPDEPLRGKVAAEAAAGINEAVDAMIHYLLHAGEVEIKLPE